MAVREDFLQRIQRAGADVAVDDADGGQRQRGQRAGRAVAGVALTEDRECAARRMLRAKLVRCAAASGPAAAGRAHS